MTKSASNQLFLATTSILGQAPRGMAALWSGLPPKLYQIENFNDSYDLQKYVNELELEDDHLVFLGISDFQVHS